MLEAKRFIVREHVGFMKMSDVYDIFDPDTSITQPVGVAKENNGGFATTMRFLINKRFMPTNIEIREKPDDALVFSMKRGWSFLQQKIFVYDGLDQLVGYFKSKVFSFTGGFHVYTPDDRHFAEVKGKGVLGWGYRFLTPEGHEMGGVDKKYEGVAKELFTSADTYAISIHEDLYEQPIAKMLLIAAALAIDIVFKE